ANEVHLPSNPAVEAGSDRVRANLAGQVDLQGRVNRYHVVVAGNECGIVGIRRWMKLENRIVVDEVEQLFRPQSETEYDLARFEVLARARDHPRFDERNYTIRHQFAVDPQIFAIAEEGKHRVGYSADAGLQDG